MGHGSNKRRMILSAVALAIFLLLSSMLGNYLLAADARAGGLDVQWKVPLTTGFGMMLVALDGSIIVLENGDLIREIDRNGTVKWEYDAPRCRDLSTGSDGRVYFIEQRANSNDSITCLYSNGSLNWNFEAERSLYTVQIGADGNIYFMENPGSNSTLACLAPDGRLIWQYVPSQGDMTGSIPVVLADGTCLVRETTIEWNNTVRPEGGWVSTYDRLVSISSEGSVIWEKDLLNVTGSFGTCKGPFVLGNDTVQLLIVTNDTQTEVGLDSGGSIIWAIQNENGAFPGTIGPHNSVFYLEVYEDQPWGYPSHMASRITSVNASSGTLNYLKEMEGWTNGPLAMSDEASLFLINGELVKLGVNGSVLLNSGHVLDSFPNNRILDDDGDCGLLMAEGSLIIKLDGNGVQTWKYRLDSRVIAGHLRDDGSVMVMTNDFAISIDRPVLTTTMNYFVVLLAIDLFVTLMTIVRFVDMIWPSSKARIE